MDILQKISFFIRRNGLAFIVFMMLLVVTQQAYTSYPVTYQMEISPDEQDASQDTPNEKRLVLSLDQSLISPGVQVNLVHAFYEIMIIGLDKGNEHTWPAAGRGLPDRLMKILFRQVISANAP